MINIVFTIHLYISSYVTMINIDKHILIQEDCKAKERGRKIPHIHYRLYGLFLLSNIFLEYEFLNRVAIYRYTQHLLLLFYIIQIDKGKFL